MSRRVVGLVLVVVTACALTAAAPRLQAGRILYRTASALPVTAAAEVPVCPGPETLQVPDGGLPVPPPGPVSLAGLAALPSALGEPDTPEASGGRVPGRAVVPLGILSRLTSGPPRAGDALAAPPSTSASTVGGAAGSAPAGPRAAGSAPAGPRAAGSAPAGPRVAGSAPAGPRAAAATPRTVATGAGGWRLDVRRVGDVPVVTAAQWTLARTGDLRGLATTTCGTAVTDTWLVGGGTQLGRRARLLLANPGVAPAVVDVTVHGPRGVVQAPAGEGVAVPPGGERALFVDALAPGLSVMAVHVTARNGRVAALLHDSVLRGAVPGGTDDVVAAAPPARRQLIAGVAVAGPVPGPGASAVPLPTDAAAPGAVAVRVAAPGGAEAVVRVHLVGSDGEINLPGGGVVTVPPRGVVDLPVTGVPNGVYAAVVEADSPVVAGAVIGRSMAARAVSPAELAWAAAGRPLQATTSIAIPPAASLVTASVASPPVATRLALAATDRDGRVVLAEVGSDGTVGTRRTVEVPVGRSVTVNVGAGSAGLLLRPDTVAGPVVAALVVTLSDVAGPMISVQPVRPGSQTAGDAPTVVQDPWTGLGG